jgi:hypothetical protein
MDQKADELQKAVDELLSSEDIEDAELGGMDDDGVAFWTLRRLSDGKLCIVCDYIDWDGEEWVHSGSISEIEGPVLLNCPIRFFNKARSKKWMFPEWRYEVKKYHEKMGEVIQDKQTALRLIDALQKK